MEQTQGQQPIRPTHPPTSGPAVEDHGRAVTANQQAAAWYRHAQRAVDCRLAAAALRLAVTADPAFELAVVDLSAIEGTTSRHPGRGQMNWERHHIEVVSAAATDDAVRAADLLREHLANVGCDPLAYRIAAHLRQPGPVTDERLPNCHPTTWKCCS
jgi:DNA-binding GntR family transcriptional regulator